MTTSQTILQDLTTAMKARDVKKLGVLRMLKAALLNTAKETGGDVADLSDDVAQAVLAREAKRRKESIGEFTKGGRADLAATEQAELAIIETYLPEQMSTGDIRVIVKAVIADTKSNNFGAVMGQAMERIAGQADGNTVKQIVEEELAV